MVMVKKIKESFLDDVKNHIMTINVNLPNGFKHITFSNPESIVHNFSIITHGDTLHYTGDMGTYSFRRPHTDMIALFGNETEIKPSYWLEKLISIDSIYGKRRHYLIWCLYALNWGCAKFLNSIGDKYD